MPNWCYNRLRVTGDKENIEKFREQGKKAEVKDSEGKVIEEKTDLSLNNFVTMPEELDVDKGHFGNDPERQKAMEEKHKENTEKYGVPTWYEWRLKNWGTKWDVSATLETNDVWEDEGYLEYFFDSAWSPPTEWLREVAKQFPTLEFYMKYEEEGNGFFGRAKAEGDNFEDNAIQD